MSDPTNPIQNLAGKNIRSWFVVCYAGQREGIRYWKCMCRASLAEKIIAERAILDHKCNSLLTIYPRWKEALDNPSDWIYGEWTVLERVSRPQAGRSRSPTLWRCRCKCGKEMDIPQDDLAKLGLPTTLSCGCRPDTEIRADLARKRCEARKGFNEACHKAWRRADERLHDNKWTHDMERALRAFQPSCVLCPATDDLVTGHVQPLNEGHGKEPGNVVRLCRACNSFVHDRPPSQLSPGQARKIETAAVEFKKHWDSGCTTPRACATAPAGEILPSPDPALVSLLRSVESGEKTAILALADWLEERGDHRANAIREMQRRRKWLNPSNEVWRRLGLSESQRNTLKLYLGIDSLRVGATIEEIARRHGKQVQTIRNTIDLALHKLTVGSPRGHCRR
jgi:uncharacterized protein (TIGR02996 family)